jgi:hypothetical protein
MRQTLWRLNDSRFPSISGWAALIGVCALLISGEGGSRTAIPVPGVVINHVPASSGEYVGSPSLAILPNGKFVASHDYAGGGKPRTTIFLSEDKGKSWKHIAEIPKQFWSSLFWHDEALYLLGTQAGMGPVIIRRSADEGATWTVPKDSKSGLLLDDDRYHTAPVPLVVYNGRIWRSMEEYHPASKVREGLFGRQFSAFVLSAPLGADLLEARNWTTSTRVRPDENAPFRGWLEGNAVVTREGDIVNILRVDSMRMPEQAAIIRVSADGRKAHFDPGKDLVAFPGGSKKFTIRWDEGSGRYWALANAILQKPAFRFPSRIRNTLALVSSTDLIHWEINNVVLEHPDPDKHAFQYADWQIDGEDIVFVSRTAYDDGMGGARRQHDANYLTFHRIPGFRRQAD